MSTQSILVVDDEPIIAMMVCDWLEEMGCAVVGPVANVASALALLTRAPVDGAILDVTLGSENCYAIAEVLSQRTVPFAFATGHGADSIDAKFVGTPILAKPYGFDDVRRIVSGFPVRS